MNNDSRKQTRIPREESVFIEIFLGEQKVSDLIAQCPTKDVSESGLKVQSSYKLDVTEIIDLQIEFVTSSLKFYLKGEVRWCNEIDVSPKSYYCGFELVDDDTTDIVKWRALFDANDQLVLPN